MNGTFERCGSRAAQTTMPAYGPHQAQGRPSEDLLALSITPESGRPSSLKSRRPSSGPRCPTS